MVAEEYHLLDHCWGNLVLGIWKTHLGYGLGLFSQSGCDCDCECDHNGSELDGGTFATSSCDSDSVIGDVLHVYILEMWL